MIGFNLLQDLKKAQSEDERNTLIAEAILELESKKMPSEVVTKDYFKAELHEALLKQTWIIIGAVGIINAILKWGPH